MRRALIIASLFAAAAVVVIGFVYVSQRQFIYFPSSAVGAIPAGAADVSFTTSDGLTLGGWFFPSSDHNAPTVVVFNGNGGNRAGRTELAREFARFGFGVLLFDYRGYGGNQGRPTEDGLVVDGVAAVNYAASRPDVDAERLVYFGESLGTGVAVATAIEHVPALLILRSPYTSLPDVVATTVFRPFAGLMWDVFPTLDRMPRVEGPVLVVAGSQDGTIPFEQSRRVYEAAPGSKMLHEVEAYHNDRSLSSGFLSNEEVAAFIEASLGDPGS